MDPINPNAFSLGPAPPPTVKRDTDHPASPPETPVKKQSDAQVEEHSPVVKHAKVVDESNKPGAKPNKAVDKTNKTGTDTTRTTKNITAKDCLGRFQRYIKHEKPMLNVFYKKGETKLQECAHKAESMIKALLKMEGCTPEIAKNLSTLVLYDLVMLLDDSSSMEEDEGGQRIKTLQNTMKAITDVYDLANENGISSVKFLNCSKGKKNITGNNVQNVLNDHYFHGVTKIGTMLDKRVLKQLVFKNPMKKPLLVMVITDGEIEGEKEELLRTVINNCIENCKSDQTRGEDAVAFHFSRVGNDEGAEALLRELDDRGGKHVDCLPVEKKLENIDGVQKWIVLHKLLLGALMKDVNDDDKEHEVDGKAGDMAEKEDSEDEEDEFVPDHISSEGE